MSEKWVVSISEIGLFLGEESKPEFPEDIRLHFSNGIYEKHDYEYPKPSDLNLEQTLIGVSQYADKVSF